MADVAKQLYQGQPGTTDTLLYTNPSASLATIVRTIHIVNASLSTCTIRLSLNSGATLVAAKAWVWDLSLAAGQAYDWTGFATISPSEFIRGLQQTAAACTFSIFGVEQ